MAEERYCAQAVSRGDIRRYAKSLRHALHLDGVEYIDIVRLAEYVFPELFKSSGFSFEILSKEDMGNNHGLTDPRAGTIFIREDVYEGACKGVGRDRLTIAHEIGHFLLHNGITIGRARIGRDEKVPAFCDPEWQATAFAAEFLMDHDVICNMSPAEIAKKCGVSYQAARFQRER